MAQYDIVFYKNDPESGVSLSEFWLSKPAGSNYALSQNPNTGLLYWQLFEPAFTKNTAFNKNFGSAADTVCQGNDSRLSDARTPAAHSHSFDTITSKPTTLAGYGITDASSLALGELISNAYRGDRGKIAYDHSQVTHAPSNANYYVHPANHPASVITQDASNRFVSDTEKTTWNAKLPSTGLAVITQAAELGSYANQVNTLQILQSTASKDAFMSFHIAGDYAAHFGLDYVTNDLFFGGWSLGAVKNRVWHAGNTATLKSSLGSMPASDVYSWAKAASKPGYSYTEIGAAAASHSHVATEVTQSASYRFVTDTEKSTWNAKGASNLVLGTASTEAYRGDYGNTAYSHSQTAHAPSNAQANADITKAEIEAKLTGVVSSHDHKFVINSQTGTTYTLALTDAAKLIRCNNAAPITLTVPPNASVAFDIGTILTVEQQGAGVVTVTAGSGVTINSTKVKTDGQYAVVQIYKVDTNVWNVIGGVA